MSSDDILAKNLQEQSHDLNYDVTKDLNANVANLFPVINNTASVTANNVLTLQEIKMAITDLKEVSATATLPGTGTNSGYNTRAQDAQRDAQIERTIVSAAREVMKFPTVKTGLALLGFALINHYWPSARLTALENIVLNQSQISATYTNAAAVKP